MQHANDTRQASFYLFRNYRLHSRLSSSLQSSLPDLSLASDLEHPPQQPLSKSFAALQVIPPFFPDLQHLLLLTSQIFNLHPLAISGRLSFPAALGCAFGIWIVASYLGSIMTTHALALAFVLKLNIVSLLFLTAERRGAEGKDCCVRLSGYTLNNERLEGSRS